MYQEVTFKLEFEGQDSFNRERRGQTFEWQSKDMVPF